MSYKVTLTMAEWDAINKTAEENTARFAKWIADDHQNPEKAVWLKSVKARYEVWKKIEQSLIDAEVID